MPKLRRIGGCAVGAKFVLVHEVYYLGLAGGDFIGALCVLRVLIGDRLPFFGHDAFYTRTLDFCPLCSTQERRDARRKLKTLAKAEAVSEEEQAKKQAELELKEQEELLHSQLCDTSQVTLLFVLFCTLRRYGCSRTGLPSSPASLRSYRVTFCGRLCGDSVPCQNTKHSRRSFTQPNTKRDRCRGLEHGTSTRIHLLTLTGVLRTIRVTVCP